MAPSDATPEREVEMKKTVPLDKIVETVASLGVPGLMLLTALGGSGLTGAAAITTALGSLGPGGMIGGVATLGVALLLVRGISEFGFDAILSNVVKQLYKQGETKETIKAKHRPIVIITSNAEKELPDAFLRRCIFHYIEFPDQQQMEKIIRVHFDHVDETLLMQAMQAFYYIRSIDSVEKKPSTSELVDWIRALQLSGVDVSKIAREIPFIGVLLKKDKDISTVQRRLRR